MNSTSPFKRLAAIAFAAALAMGALRTLADDFGAAPAGGGQKYDLKLVVQEGQKWQFDNSSKSDTTSQITANGQQQQMQQAQEQRRKGTVEIGSVTDGQPASMKIQFDHDCNSRMSQNGQQQDQPFPLADKTVTVSRGADGQVTNDANADAPTAAELAQMLVPDRSIYPKSPVSVGDEWQADPTALAKQFQLGADDSVSMKCKLLKIGQLDNVKTADISISGTISKVQNGITTKIVLGGIARVDLASGQALAADLLGKITISGTGQFPTQQGPVQVAMDGGGRMEVHQSIKQLTGGQPDAHVNGVPTAAPDAPPAGGASAGNTPTPNFAGAFKNEKIIVDLQPADASGQFIGSITMGAQKFPAKATAASNKLTGSFDANGDSYDFTATVDGSTMTFASGSKTYILKKKANPLDDAGPAKRNPLDDGPAPAPPPKPNPLDPQVNNAPAPAPAAGGGVSGGGNARGKTLVMKKITIADPMIGCDAGNLLIPENWQCDGKMVWKENAFYPVSAALFIHDAQSLRACAVYPQGLYCDGIRESAAQTAAIAGPQAMQAAANAWPEGGNYMGSEVRKRVDPAQYIQNFFVPLYRKDLASAQAGQPVSVPELARIKAKAYSTYPGLDVQTVKVRFSYELEGKPVDEDVFVTLYTMPMPGSPLVFWNTDAESYRAERGQLDAAMPLYRSILSTVRPTLPWFNGVMQVSKMMQDNMRQSIENAGKLSKYIAQVNNDISDMIKSSYEQKCKSDDITMREVSQTTRGIDVYGDGENRYEVPIGYDHYYKNDQGQILMTSDSGFDPNKGGWREMQRNPER